MEITPKLIEQTRRWLARLIWNFHHDLTMSSKGDEAFEQWHEDRAKEFLGFLNMSEGDRQKATEELHVSSINPKRLKAIK